MKSWLLSSTTSILPVHLAPLGCRVVTPNRERITMTIYAIISAILCFVVIGFLLIPALYVIDIVFTIIAAIKSNDGIPYQYPLTIRFIK